METELLSKEAIFDMSTDMYDKKFMALYFLIKDTGIKKQEILYIGYAQHFGARLTVHIKNKKISFNKYFYIKYNDLELVKKHEKLYIKKFKPLYNIHYNPIFIKECEIAVDYAKKNDIAIPRGRARRGWVLKIFNEMGIRSQLKDMNDYQTES